MKDFKIVVLLLCLLECISLSLSFRPGCSWSTNNNCYTRKVAFRSTSITLTKHKNTYSSIMRHFAAPKPSGIATTREGKAKILERTQNLLQNTSAILAAPIKGVNMEQIDMLRKIMPEGTIASVVKNSLMKISVQNTPFAEIVKEAKDEIMYFFIPEGFMKKSYDAFQKWLKEVKRTEPEHQIRFLALDNSLFKEKDMEEVVKLPPKKELIAKIAWLLKQIPLKLGMDIRAIPDKLGFAVNEIKKQLEQQESTSSPSSEGSPGIVPPS